MIDKLLPLIKEHFDEEKWTLNTHFNVRDVYDSHNKVKGQKTVEHICIESKYEFTEINIGYDTSENKLWIGGQDIPYDTYRLIHDIIEEAKHDIKTIRCQECGAIIDTPDNKYRYYIGMEYHCKACNNTGFIRTEDIWTTTE